MNATCPAGISQPQRVSDLGRLLDSEITAPLDSTPAGGVHPPAWRLPLCMAPPPAWRLLLCMAPSSAWRLPLYKAPSSMARALCKAPSSMARALCKAPSSMALALCKAPLPLAPALCKAPSPLAPALCMAPSPRHVQGGTTLTHPTHGAPCVSQPKANFLKDVAFPKKRCCLPHLAHVSHLSQPQAGFARGPAQQDRRRVLRVPFGTTQEEFSFNIQQQVLLPALSSSISQSRLSKPRYGNCPKLSAWLRRPVGQRPRAFGGRGDVREVQQGAITLQGPSTDMQIDARCASTSSARFDTTTPCTAVVPGASDAGLPAPRLACNAMSTGAQDST